MIPPHEIETKYVDIASGASVEGVLIAENLPEGWTPICLSANGTKKKFGGTRTTIGEAKAEFSAFTAHRNWTEQEKALIPNFPDDQPVMLETIRIARRIVSTRDDIRPVSNVMWRGVTSYGKSTGIKQLACILNIPLLILTCHPNMEAQDFMSQYVPDARTEGILLDMNNVQTPARSTAAITRKLPPRFEEAMRYVMSLDSGAQESLVDTLGFLSMAFCDPCAASSSLFGTEQDMELEELIWTHSEVANAIREQPMKARLAELEALNEQPKEEKSGGSENSNALQFVHVVSPYLKALVNGYLVEIQEASRIRDSGVLVSTNEYDHAGAIIHLMNGYTATRHKDAICVITDNVGYTSCRPIDPSVLRRQDLIIDSYELPKDILLDRVKRNTKCEDNDTVQLCYDLWLKVKEYCEQNAITEGSVSPTELERLVQAIHHEGIDSMEDNLNDCVISKATSSIEDQREIRTVCQVLIAGF